MPDPSNSITASTLARKLDISDAPPWEEMPQCQLCESIESELLFWNCDRLFHTPGKFGVVRCAQCGLVRLSPRPAAESLKFYYPDDEYYTYQVPLGSYENSGNNSGLGDRLRSGVRETVVESLGYPVSLKRWQKVFQPLFTRLFMDQGTRGWRHKLPRYVPDGAALDVGCGNGSFLGLLRHLGWRAKGIEMNGQAAAIAREHFGLDIHRGTIDDFPAGEERFDYINLSHVLEHVYEPRVFLEKVRDLLTPDGIIYIELPNADSFGQRMSREFWYPWETPRHIYMFSPKTLSLQLEKAGLLITRLETTLGNMWQWDATYRVEDATGEKCPTRPAETREIRAEASRLARAAAAEFRRDPMSGDIISCWVKRDR